MLPGWQRTMIAGKPADTFDPPGGPPQFVLLFLHAVGSESLANNAAYTVALAEARAACCVPFTGRSWWSDRVCSEFDLALTAERFVIDHVRPWMLDHWKKSEKAFGCFGISMGGQGAIRLGLKHPHLFPAVAGVASAFDYHEWYGVGSTIDEMYRSREACRQDTAILHLDGMRVPHTIAFACDPNDVDWYRGNDRLHEKLGAFGVPHAADLTTEAGGHSWDYFDAMAPWVVGQIAEGLAGNVRRLM
jgi:S-formylglutathione hydrolase FrmB